MTRYLCIAAVWVEGENTDDAGDRLNERLSGGLRAEGTVGCVTVYTEAQTRQEGFLKDAAAFDLEEAVVPPGATGGADDANAG